MEDEVSKYNQVIDVSEWEEKPWFNSGGTRNKRILASPEGYNFYFK